MTLITNAVEVAAMRLATATTAIEEGARSTLSLAANVQNFARKLPLQVSVTKARLAERHAALAGGNELSKAAAGTSAPANDVTRGNVLVLHNGVDHWHRYPHLLGELKSQGAEAHLHRLGSAELTHDGRFLLKGKEAPMPDAIIARPVFDRDLALLTALERKGVFVVDSPGTLRAANSKAELARVFVEHGVPSPETSVVTDRAAMDAAAAKLGLADGKPVVLKTDKDSGGRGVWLARTQADYDRLAPMVMAKAAERGEPAIVQRFYKITPEAGVPEGTGVDRRVIVMRGDDGKPHAFMGYLRVARGNDFRANGGEFGNNYTRLDPSGNTAGLTKQELGIAEQAVEAAGVDYAGVDIMRTEQGPMAIEINPTPGTPELDLQLPRDEHALPRLARFTVHGTRPGG